MMRSSFTGLAGLLVVAALSSGCLNGGDAAVDETEATTDELSLAGWQGLTGAWVGTSGSFDGLVITRTVEGQGRHFFADVDTGIRCITTPCPSSAHLEGRVTAGTRNLTLRHPDRPSRESAPFYGTYAYTLSGSTLTLAQNGRIVARLRKATSYCSDADQCAEQGLITPRCLGRFECESNACRYRCGQPPRPTCATTLCAPGTICQEDSENGARCITACATVRCTATTTCVADANGARCVPRTCANTPTTCAAGQMCVDGDSGPTCITRCAAVRCAAGTTCVADAAGVRCQPIAGACDSDSDCRLSDNYCGGCACDALGPGQRAATCSNPVACFRQPCGGMTARCDTASHRCQAVTAPVGVRCGTTTCGAGLVCCNPLRNICTAPGMFCIQ